MDYLKGRLGLFDDTEFHNKHRINSFLIVVQVCAAIMKNRQSISKYNVDGKSKVNKYVNKSKSEFQTDCSAHDWFLVQHTNYEFNTIFARIWM